MHNEAQYFLSLLYGRQGPCEPYLLWLCASHASLINDAGNDSLLSLKGGVPENTGAL